MYDHLHVVGLHQNQIHPRRRTFMKVMHSGVSVESPVVCFYGLSCGDGNQPNDGSGIERVFSETINVGTSSVHMYGNSVCSTN